MRGRVLLGCRVVGLSKLSELSAGAGSLAMEPSSPRATFTARHVHRAPRSRRATFTARHLHGAQIANDRST